MTTHSWVIFHANAKRFLEWTNEYKTSLAYRDKGEVRKKRVQLSEVCGQFFDSALAASEALNKKLLDARTCSEDEIEAMVSDDEITLANYLLDVTRCKRYLELLGLFSGGKILNPESDLKEIVRISQKLAQNEKQN